MSVSSSPGALLRDVARLYVRAQRAQATCRDGASTVQCHVLTELSRHDGLSLQALVQRLGLDKAWLSRAVDALVDDGSVAKKPSQQDRRSVHLSLTRRGRARTAKLELALNSHAAQLLDSIPPERHAQIQESLHWLLGALQQGVFTDTPVSPCTGSLSGQPAAAPKALTLRPARRTDWSAIKRLLTAAKLPLDGAREHLGQFVVGVWDTQVVCAAGLEVYGSTALLRSVVVDEAARGQACARPLLAQLVQQGRAQGVRKLFLLTTTAADYFSRLGFKAINRKAVPATLRQSHEFQGACPDSAIAMVLRLDT